MPDNQDSGQGGQANQDQGQQGDQGQGAQGAADQAAAKAAADAAAAKPADFKGSLPEEMRTHPAADKFKNTGELFKSYTELEKMVGLEKIPLPKKDKAGNYDPEGVKSVMTRLGMPKDPEGYKLDKVKIPDGVPVDATAMTGLKGLYHKLNLLPHQAEGMTQFMMDYIKTGQDGMSKKTEADRQAAEASLKTEWGAAYPQKVALAKKALKAFADENDIAYIDQGAGNDLRLIKIFAKIGESMSEDQIDKGEIFDSTMTPAQAAKEISDIRNNKQNPMHAILMNQLHPEHGKVLERLADLYKMAHPEQE